MLFGRMPFEHAVSLQGASLRNLKTMLIKHLLSDKLERRRHTNFLAKQRKSKRFFNLEKKEGLANAKERGEGILYAGQPAASIDIIPWLADISITKN